MWVNSAGERFWVKYHFKTDQGVEYFTQDEADQLVSADTDYHTRDLFEAIGRGEHPSWTLFMQVMPFDDAKNYRFNPFDLTKVWPHGDYPLIEVGRMTLDRNPTDHHAEIEQAAFEPNNLVPGIGSSPDRMLQGRLFAYADAHRYRIGANYRQLPVNASTSPVHSYSKDGAMRYTPVSDPVYAPNSKGGPRADVQRYGTPVGWALTARWCARPMWTMPRTTTGARRAPWCARSSTTMPATASPTTSSITCSTASPSRCWRGRSSTGTTSTRTSVTASRPACAPSRARRTRRPPNRATPRGRACNARPEPLVVRPPMTYA
jgi:Catalase